jgi:LacI family transcriptional regulator
MLDSHNPSGVILDSNIQCCENIAEMISGKKINVIIFGHERDFPEFSTVMTDSFNGALDAVKYLAGKGHRKIGTIRWNSAVTPNSAKKFSAYQCALAERGIPFNPDYVIEAASSNSKMDDSSKRPGRDAFEKLIKQAGKNPPTAIFIENSFVSHSLIYPLQGDRGKLPQNIRNIEFIHFEDTSLSAAAQIMNGRLNYDPPSLQCCHINWEEMGRIAGDLMIRMIKIGESSIHSIRIKPELKYFRSGEMRTVYIH